jgi:hypothetical protein
MTTILTNRDRQGRGGRRLAGKHVRVVGWETCIRFSAAVAGNGIVWTRST